MTSETQPAAVPKSASAIGITKVAIVEDQRDIREGLASLIKFTDGYLCTGSFRSMEEALEKIRFEVPEIMLVDIGLPGMNGIDLISRLEKGHPEMLAILITATSRERLDQALSHHHVVYFRKPLDFPELLKTLQAKPIH